MAPADANAARWAAHADRATTDWDHSRAAAGAAFRFTAPKSVRGATGSISIESSAHGSVRYRVVRRRRRVFQPSMGAGRRLVHVGVERAAANVVAASGGAIDAEERTVPARLGSAFRASAADARARRQSGREARRGEACTTGA